MSRSKSACTAWAAASELPTSREWIRVSVLRPAGDVAFTGLWILLAWLVPLVLTGVSDLVGVAIGAAVLASALATFFLSLARLHHQMVVEQQRHLLAAADTLEKRAKSIHDWPIDESTLARVLTIATSVAAITIGRLILDPFGL